MERSRKESTANEAVPSEHSSIVWTDLKKTKKIKSNKYTSGKVSMCSVGVNSIDYTLKIVVTGNGSEEVKVVWTWR